MAARTKQIAAMAAFGMLASLGGCGDPGASELASICRTSSDMPGEICDCIADRAGETLSPEQIDFVIAAINEDEAATARLRGQMDFAEMTEAGMFMVSGPQVCAAGLAG